VDLWLVQLPVWRCSGQVNSHVFLGSVLLQCLSQPKCTNSYMVVGHETWVVFEDNVRPIYGFKWSGQLKMHQFLLA